MALLYERSALWRAIVAATKDPRVLVAFTLATGAAGYALGKGSQFVTSVGSEQTKDEIEKKLRKDAEAARYASHSKNALAVMLDSFKPDSVSKEDNSNDKYKKNQIKLPGVMWHPKVMEKEKAAAKKINQKDQDMSNLARNSQVASSSVESASNNTAKKQ